MKRQIALFVLALGGASLWAQQATVSGPDSLLKVDISVTDGNPFYSVTYRGKTILENSPLGFVSNVGDFSRGMTYAGQKSRTIKEDYRLDRIKRSEVAYRAKMHLLIFIFTLFLKSAVIHDCGFLSLYTCFLSMSVEAVHRT